MTNYSGRAFEARQRMSESVELAFSKPLILMKALNSRIILAIYLTLVGLGGLFGIKLGEASIIMPILALAAGILMLLGK
jgi:hypothetical protein